MEGLSEVGKSLSADVVQSGAARGKFPYGWWNPWRCSGLAPRPVGRELRPYRFPSPGSSGEPANARISSGEIAQANGGIAFLPSVIEATTWWRIREGTKVASALGRSAQGGQARRVLSSRESPEGGA